ncbi:L-propargylglycine--L-glutamate ligase BesA [Streptomyces sp. NPDC006658]|uniref:L-propargylglycine--L-glutamate ligase BesA n=1 Tax=Streptomyces sp. NPDC006658 TaxID=3156900 RepID=UPI00340D9F3A
MTDPGSTKILIYAFNYADRMLEEVPYLRYSAERSLCFLGDLRDPDTRMVVITSEAVDPCTLDYHLREVLRFDERTLDDVRRRLTLLTPASRAARPLDSLVVEDEALVETLRRTVSERPAGVIVNFSASPATDELGRRTGAAPEEGGHPFVARWGGKGGGKEICLRAGVAVPKGTSEVLHSEEEVVEAIHRLSHGTAPARRAMVKLAPITWAASIGNVLVDCERLRHTGDLLASAEVIRLPADEFRRELARHGAIVEEFLDKVTDSPSGLGRVERDGTVRAVACHDQVLSGGQYWGCRFPGDERWRPAIVDAVRRSGEVLSGLGHRGTFGVDFVVAGERGLLAVEINLRKVGPSHVIRCAEALVGARVGADGMLRGTDGRPVYYTHGRLLEPETLGKLNPRAAVERLRSEGLLYRHDTGEGVALHVLGALNACGFVELTALAHAPDAADDYSRAAQAVLTGPDPAA